MSHAFVADAMKLSARRNMKWYRDNLMRVLLDAKKKQARDIDVSIALAERLIKLIEEPVDKPVSVPLRDVQHSEDDSLMKPIPPEVTDIFYKSTEKGGAERYLKERNKLSPEDKFFFRIVTSWDYGWQQKKSRVLARDVNRGRCAILKQTFYRKNNLGPDPSHYAEPTGAQVSICSEYSCKATNLGLFA